MADWIALCALPNVSLRTPIDGEMMALAPVGDDRVVACGIKGPAFLKFISQFTSAFGTKLEPAVLICRDDAPDSVRTADAVSSFRDVISASVIPRNRALALSGSTSAWISYAEAFWIYPWMVGKDGERLYANTPALCAIHRVSEFGGQSTPEVAVSPLGGEDQPLLEALIARWQRRYTSPDPSWQDLALFRSLNMANVAMKLPAGIDVTVHDLGRTVAIWISAFEILVHPGKGGNVGLQAVYDHLNKISWLSDAFRKQEHQTYCTKNSTHRTLACWIYGELYNARNAFLHGNPIDIDGLKLPRSRRMMTGFAAPLYRMALAAFLDLFPLVDVDDDDEFPTGKESSEYIRRVWQQNVFEEALKMAIVPLPEGDSSRR